MSETTPRFGDIAQANNTAAAIAAGVTLAEPSPLGDGNGLFSVLLPDGARHELVDINDVLERLADVPKRAKGTVAPQTVDDLARYVTRHDDADATTVWVDVAGHTITAVLNDHAGEGAGWGDHRAVLRLALTTEWQRWKRHDGAYLSQEDFAEHIELGLVEIVQPDAADMLEIAQHIEGTKSAEFQGGHRLQSGAVAIQYVETVAARAGARGDLEIPARFKLAIAPFLGEEPAELWARFRYRIRGDKLVLGYLLERPEDVIRASVDGIAQRLVGTFGDHRVFVGTPRS